MSRRSPGRRFRAWAACRINGLRIRYFRMMGVEIGERSFVSFGAHIDLTRGEIQIGRHVSISHGTYVLSHTGYQRLKPGQKTVIEDDVRIFVNSVIFPGVRIGRNSVVAAGSVVTKDVPPNVIVMGNPARVIVHLDAEAKPPEAPAAEGS